MFFFVCVCFLSSSGFLSLHFSPFDDEGDQVVVFFFMTIYLVFAEFKKVVFLSINKNVFDKFSVTGPINILNEAQDGCIICVFNEYSVIMGGETVVGVQGVEFRPVEESALFCSCADCELNRDLVSYSYFPPVVCP